MAVVLCFVFAIVLSRLSVMGAVEDCPPWFKEIDEKSSNISLCVCSDASEYGIMCDQIDQMSFLTLGFCALYDSAINDTVIANCPYVFPKHLIVDGHTHLPQRLSELNQFICGNLN